MSSAAVVISALRVNFPENIILLPVKNIERHKSGVCVFFFFFFFFFFVIYKLLVHMASVV